MSSATLVRTQRPASTPPPIGQCSDSLLRRRAIFSPPVGTALDLAQYERSTITEPTDRPFGHNLAHIHVSPSARVPIQPKIRINEPGDMYV
jgi:hypothetical protein